MVGVENFEISTYWLKASYSASELHAIKTRANSIRAFTSSFNYGESAEPYEAFLL